MTTTSNCVINSKLQLQQHYFPLSVPTPRNVTVITIVGPVITAEEAMVTAVVGTTATFRCTTSGDPTPAQNWTRDGMAITDSRVQIGSSGSVLTISNVREEDQGTYHCDASNVAGSINATVELNVISKFLASDPIPKIDSKIHFEMSKKIFFLTIFLSVARNFSCYNITAVSFFAYTYRLLVLSISTCRCPCYYDSCR